MQSDSIRLCIKCGASKPLTEFYANHSAKDGRMGRCRSCRLAQSREWVKANPERAKAMQDRADKRYREKFSPEEWKRKGQESRRKYNASPEGMAARQKWRTDNKERLLTIWCKGRCKNHGITIERYEELLRAQHGVCAICHQPEQRRGARSGTWSLSIDHNHNCCPGRFGCARCVRGLLCAKCNQAIALLSEDSRLFQSAVDYLRRAST